MKIILVGTHHGKNFINWPGVVIGSIAVVLTGVVGTMLMWQLLDRTFSLLPFLMMSVPLLLLFLIVLNVKRALRLPPEQVKPLV